MMKIRTNRLTSTPQMEKIGEWWSTFFNKTLIDPNENTVALINSTLETESGSRDTESITSVSTSTFLSTEGSSVRAECIHVNSNFFKDNGMFKIFTRSTLVRMFSKSTRNKLLIWNVATIKAWKLKRTYNYKTWQSRFFTVFYKQLTAPRVINFNDSLKPPLD